MMLHHAALGNLGTATGKPSINPSSMGMQKLVKMAKLEGAYIPEALMSKLYSKNEAKSRSIYVYGESQAFINDPRN